MKFTQQRRVLDVASVCCGYEDYELNNKFFVGKTEKRAKLSGELRLQVCKSVCACVWQMNAWSQAATCHMPMMQLHRLFGNWINCAAKWSLHSQLTRFDINMNSVTVVVFCSRAPLDCWYNPVNTIIAAAQTDLCENG